MRLKPADASWLVMDLSARGGVFSGTATMIPVRPVAPSDLSFRVSCIVGMVCPSTVTVRDEVSVTFTVRRGLEDIVPHPASNTSDAARAIEIVMALVVNGAAPCRAGGTHP